MCLERMRRRKGFERAKNVYSLFLAFFTCMSSRLNKSDLSECESDEKPAFIVHSAIRNTTLPFCTPNADEIEIVQNNADFKIFLLWTFIVVFTSFSLIIIKTFLINGERRRLASWLYFLKPLNKDWVLRTYALHFILSSTYNTQSSCVRQLAYIQHGLSNRTIAVRALFRLHCTAFLLL